MNNYFPGIGIFSMMNNEDRNSSSTNPSPAPQPEVIIAEPLDDSSLILSLKDKIKELENENKSLKTTNIRLRDEISLLRIDYH